MESGSAMRGPGLLWALGSGDKSTLSQHSLGIISATLFLLFSPCSGSTVPGQNVITGPGPHGQPGLGGTARHLG